MVVGELVVAAEEVCKIHCSLHTFLITPQCFSDISVWSQGADHLILLSGKFLPFSPHLNAKKLKVS